MRPVPPKYEMNFGYGRKYPEEIAARLGISDHHGQDFLTPVGVNVRGAVDGWFLDCGEYRGYGLSLDIVFYVGALSWKKWFMLRYAHLLKNSILFSRRGERIRKTDVVARTGATGTFFSDGPGRDPRPHPHLHVETWKIEKVRGVWIRSHLVDPGFVTGEA